MKHRPIQVDSTLQELTAHGTDGFPMSMDEQQVSGAGCSQIRHWHYEVQIALMTKGSAIFETPAGRYLLHTGEGIFLNSGVLHQVLPTAEPDSVYICANFRPELIYGQTDSVIRRDYVEPLLSSADLQSFALRDEPWHQEVLQTLRELAAVHDAQEYGYELVLKMLLCRIWHLILVHNRIHTEKVAAVSFADKQRVKLLKNYIHQNYMDHICLADISNAGHISRSECCRVFRRTGEPTPILYLKQYRISQSVKLLAFTDLSIAEVAWQTGFESSSYYAECFKKEMGCTPNEYRAKFAKKYTAASADRLDGRSERDGRCPWGEKCENQESGCAAVPRRPGEPQNCAGDHGAGSAAAGRL